VVSVTGKGGRASRQARSRKTSESKPLMTCRNRIVDVKTRGDVDPGISVGGDLKTGPEGIRPVGGVILDQALARNARTCRPEVKEEDRTGEPRQVPSTEAGAQGPAARSRDEGSVIELDRRRCGVQPRRAANR
jgi:hypothetical protein